MGLIIFFISMIAMGVIADNKGFNPACWVFAGGLLGLIILLAMPSANNAPNEATKQERIKAGDSAGLFITVVAIFLIVVMVFN